MASQVKKCTGAPNCPTAIYEYCHVTTIYCQSQRLLSIQAIVVLDAETILGSSALKHQMLIQVALRSGILTRESQTINDRYIVGWLANIFAKGCNQRHIGSNGFSSEVSQNWTAGALVG